MANNAEKSLNPAAYLNFREEEVFSRWVAVWFDFHSQLLSRYFPPSLFCGTITLCPYTPFSEPMCFPKTWPSYCSFEVQKNLQFFSDKFSLFIVMEAKIEKERRKERNPPSPQHSVAFFPAAEFIVLIPSCTGKLSSMPYENFKNEALI